MPACPICSGKTLRHIRHSQIYWYCPQCHQEVPNLKTISTLKSSDFISYKPSYKPEYIY